MEQTAFSNQTTDHTITSKQVTLIKLPIQKLMETNFQVTIDAQEEQNFLIAQGDSLLFDQIERLRGSFSRHVSELILVTAKKSPKTDKALTHILSHGFSYNNTRYLRFGKSASQSKDGITAFQKTFLIPCTALLRWIFPFRNASYQNTRLSAVWYSVPAH